VGNQDTFCYNRAFGKYIAIKDSAKNLVLWYAHLGSMDVTPGQTVLKNAKIGTVGATGLETGPHLHFSVFDANGFTMTPRNGCGPMPTGQDLNPLNYLSTIF
jgi:murein DD-endopeptidase MepM/ murein hydrolase activator NlpD